MRSLPRLHILCASLCLCAAVRKYTCVPQWRLGQGQPDPFAPSIQRGYQRSITTATAAWNVSLNGTADMDNTLTPSANCKNVTYQPDIEIAITNQGMQPVKNPRVVSNGRRRWFTMEGEHRQKVLSRFVHAPDTISDIVQDAHFSARDDTDRMFLSWDFLRAVHYHSEPLFGNNELHDPVKYLNMYGTGFCDDAGNSFCSLNWHANFTQNNYGKDTLWITPSLFIFRCIYLIIFCMRL